MVRLQPEICRIEEGVEEIEFHERHYQHQRDAEALIEMAEEYAGKQEEQDKGKDDFLEYPPGSAGEEGF